MTPATNDADASLPRRIASAMMERDNASRLLGIELVAIERGRATVRMTIVDAMTNGHAIAHGGMIFTLADTAFAYACNSGNETSVAAHCSVTFVAPGKAGDVLEAIAEERSLRGRTGIYDVLVRNAATLETIALFRGNSARIGGAIVEV